jgi:hypothetical protein
MFDVGYDTYSLVFGATSRSTASRAGTRRMRSLPVTLAAGFRQCAPSEIGELWIIAADDLEEIVLAPLRAGKSIGEIVLQEQVRPIPTGLIDRQYRGGVIELVEGRRGATVIGGRIVDMRKAERALLAQPEVKECVVVMRYEADEPRTIAYVGVRTLREDAVLNASASLRATLPSGIAIDYIVPLLSLPLDAAGAVDIAELMKIPVIDDVLVSRVAEKFANDGTGPLTVFAVDFRLSRPRDVVPHF